MSAAGGGSRKAEGETEIQTSDSHPGEHGDGGEVAKVGEDDAGKGALGQLEVEDGDEVGSDEANTKYIAHNYLAMHVEEVRNRDIDQEGASQEHQADHSEDGEHQAQGGKMEVTGMYRLRMKTVTSTKLSFG